jgi:hypothetical protein
MHSCRQGVNWENNKKIDRCRDQEKRDHGVNKIADGELAAVDCKDKRREVWLPYNRSDKRSDQILDERGNHRAECHSDDDADRHINDVATHQKLLEALHSSFLPQGFAYTGNKAEVSVASASNTLAKSRFRPVRRFSDRHNSEPSIVQRATRFNEFILAAARPQDIADRLRRADHLILRGA